MGSKFSIRSYIARKTGFGQAAAGDVATREVKYFAHLFSSAGRFRKCEL